MQTLAQAQQLTQDNIIKGVIEEILTVSDLMNHLPFDPIVGNGRVFNIESTQPTAQWYDSRDQWVESTGTRTQKTFNVKILGGDVDVNQFDVDMYGDINNQTEIAMKEKSKAIAYEFEDVFIYGDDSTDSKKFDGLHVQMDSAQDVNQGSGSTGAALSLAKLDEMHDLIKPGSPDFYIMNRRMRRMINQFYRSNAGSPQVKGADGKYLSDYGGIPILVNDFITITETIASGAYSAKTGGSSTSIFGVKFGDRLVTGLQNGTIRKIELGMLESKPASRWRFYWYVGLAVVNKLALARVDGILTAASNVVVV